MDAPLLLPGTVFPPPDDEAARQWLALVHELARQRGGRVNGGIEAPRVDRSFYAVTVELRDGTVTLMLNVGARLVACVSGDKPFPADGEFIDVPGQDAFLLAGLHVASAADMLEPFDERHLAHLGGEEAQQVKYHRPLRVDDVLFNWFD